jgi:hypothetical protein
MAMTHEELVAKRETLKAKGNWDSTKPVEGPKFVVTKTIKTVKTVKESK